METYESKSHLTPIVQQVKNNTTSWIGHRRDETANRISGQTFICPAEGNVDCIEIFSDYVTENGKVDLTIHLFDNENKTWGIVLGTSTVEFKKNDTGKWIPFPLPGLHLDKGRSYGFRLKCDTGLFGVGEAAGNVNQLPYYHGGQEWVATSENQSGSFYSYLSLAFKVEMRA